ncbi:MAG: Asp-tRNA(Asn)/Glu-tRNA(Gln) amidotransferase subunit GatA [Lentisphaeria bacterium]|nr:Asp-tRNA(Asn)/Glu-tRNA(Gln) amidotransferase subunit GatA [Lentisphaeria bacterium]
MDLKKLTMVEAADLLNDGKISSLELCQAYLDRIAAVEPAVSALLSLDQESVLAQAKESDARRAAGKTFGRFDGVPVTIKDNIAVKGQPCTCASRILEKFVSPYDATVISKLRQNGMVLMGRANMDEFAMGSSCENSAYKKTCNPWNLECVPGGSSGGSAAAVAAGETVIALGSDTGGSIRQPASFCGIVGLKPTYGRVSRFGLVAFASSLDQIGPMSKDVLDSAAMLDLITGQDVRDTTSLPAEVPQGGFAAQLKGLQGDLKGVRIGIPKEYFEVEGVAPGVAKVTQEAMDVLKSLGAEFVDISLPHTKYSMACYYIIAPAEASANLARFDGIRYGYRSENADDLISTYLTSRGEGFGPEVTRRIMLGTYVLSSGYYDAYYVRAQKVRTLIRRDFTDAFEKCDVIFTPVAPATAFKFGEKSDPMQMYLSDVFTTALNLAGNCGISVPAGIDPDTNMPSGIQLIAPSLAEDRLFKTARSFEMARGIKEFTAPL